MIELFNNEGSDFIDTQEHGIMFVASGKPKTTYESIKKGTEEKKWEFDGSFFYRDKANNLTIYLSPMSKNTLIFASVLTLHELYMDKHR
ncbi:hypothetical protein CLU81_0494 [Flavobacterium sp. 9]|nr:hypothetical protein CLU81_0494 [Flavobacterium sp. 9]